MKFKIVSFCDKRLFEERVERSLNKGWKLHGGVSVVDSKTICQRIEYFVAMVKDD